jgi:hypothetical protein
MQNSPSMVKPQQESRSYQNRRLRYAPPQARRSRGRVLRLKLDVPSWLYPCVRDNFLNYAEMNGGTEEPKS